MLASFLFYGYNNPSYVPIIAGSILINYALSQLMLTQQKKALRLPLMLLGLFLKPRCAVLLQIPRFLL